MGKGDKRSKRGKIWRGTSGKTRLKPKNVAKNAVEVKVAAPKAAKPAAPKAEKPAAAKKPAAPKAAKAAK